MSKIRVGHALAISLALLASTGCKRIKERIAEKATEAIAEKATGAEVDIGSSSGNVTVRTPDGGAILRTGATLPDGWPPAAPLYPGATIVGSVSVQRSKQVSFTTTDPISKVYEFYKLKLPGTENAAIDSGDGKMLVKSDGTTTYSATIGKRGTGAVVQLVVSTR